MEAAMQGAEKLRVDIAPTLTEPVALDRRHDPDVRKGMSGPAIRSFLKIADEAWGLNVDQQRALLGWIGASTYHKYKAGDVGTLSYDTLTRVSLVLGIYKALHILFPDPELADKWVRLPNKNKLFAGRSPIEFMANGEMANMYLVRRLLDGRRGGWN